MIDALGKETLINATIERYQNEANAGKEGLQAELNEVFGKETTQLIEDLKSGEITENVKLLAFNTLMDFQPAALSEMPQYYLQNAGGFGRMFYQLKTFTIKQLDVFRNQAFDKMRSDNIETRKDGLRNLGHLMTVFVLANGTADWLKDLIMGREIHYDDLLIDNVFKLVGGSRFVAWQVRQKGPVEAGLQYFFPPQVSMATRMWYDGKKLLSAGFDDEKSLPEAAKNLNSANFIPVVGKPYYWWFGGGHDKNIEQELKHYKEVMEDRSLNQQEVDKYIEYIKRALEDGILTPRTAKKRIKGIRGNR